MFDPALAYQDRVQAAKVKKELADREAELQSLRAQLKKLHGALRRIGYGDVEMLREWLSENDPDGYYPNADRSSLMIHVARTASRQPIQ